MHEVFCEAANLPSWNGRVKERSVQTTKGGLREHGRAASAAGSYVSGLQGYWASCSRKTMPDLRRNGENKEPVTEDTAGYRLHNCACLTFRAMSKARRHADAGVGVLTSRAPSSDGAFSCTAAGG